MEQQRNSLPSLPDREPCCSNCEHFTKELDDVDIQYTSNDGMCKNPDCLWDGHIRKDFEGNLCPDFALKE